MSSLSKRLLCFKTPGPIADASASADHDGKAAHLCQATSLTDLVAQLYARHVVILGDQASGKHVIEKGAKVESPFEDGSAPHERDVGPARRFPTGGVAMHETAEGQCGKRRSRSV